jgi:hypothetical protein
MGTLASELGPHVARAAEQPRVYVDANMPAALVGFMRHRWRWDVFFVLEHEELRRATDLHHFRTARQLRRTLITLDRDYLDARKFPPAESGGVVVLTAPDEKRLFVLLAQLDRDVLRRPAKSAGGLTGAEPVMPLEGRTEHLTWQGDADASRS